MVVRCYEPTDREDVRRVHAAAFGGPGSIGALPVEVELLDRLIDAGDVIAPLSLVAVRDDQVVGHVVCSRAAVGSHAVAGLGPIGVLPAHQGHGVGTALMHALLPAADALEVPLVALLGSRDFYSRFGFVPAVQLGIDAPDREWGDAFQARALAAYHPGIRGRFRYAPAFDSPRLPATVGSA